MITFLHSVTCLFYCSWVIQQAMNKIFFIVLTYSLLIGSWAQAKAVYLSSLQGAYSVQVPQRCNVCHSKTSLALNAFGKDFSELKRQMTLSEVWTPLGELDSDQDGVSNQEELKNSKNPGILGQ